MNSVFKWSLIWPFLVLLILPLVVAWVVYPNHLPPGFGEFPPVQILAPPEPSFNLSAFIIILLVEAAILLCLLFPKWFGFLPPPPAPSRPAPVAFPVWFWIGLVLTMFFWWLMWARLTFFGDLVYYAFTPLWWGFIFLLDGLVYRRKSGISLCATRPTILLSSALVSVGGWFFFEYLDYFALGNWYYPNGHMPQLSHTAIVTIFLIAYTTVWPVVFEWYDLLNTSHFLVGRYARGPKLVLSGSCLLWLGFILIAVMVVFPFPFFWAMWIGPLCVFAGQLIRKNIWTPFSAMAEGNWSPVILISLSSLCTGFFWELWNWGSSQPNPSQATNPNYWIYEVPYVNVIHIFSEMPILGYSGYLPFGIMVWLFFIWAGEVFGFDSRISD